MKLRYWIILFALLLGGLGLLMRFQAKAPSLSMDSEKTYGGKNPRMILLPGSKPMMIISMARTKKRTTIRTIMMIIKMITAKKREAIKKMAMMSTRNPKRNPLAGSAKQRGHGCRRE